MKQRQAIARTRKAVTAKDRQERSFQEIVGLIQQAQGRAYQAVNTALIDLYWRVGEYISRKLESAAWGEGVVDELAQYIARNHSDWRGFARPNLFRMRQFYTTYRNETKVSALLRQLPWTHNVLILGKCRRAEEREFYLRMTALRGWQE
jgi:predicted nuclease of restriction endonuclease-like (RecB) superfamily